MLQNNIEAIEKLLSRGVETIYPNREVLEQELNSGKKLRLYIGVDPTSPHLHIGHAIGLRKMREFQDLGHEVILLIGSFTAMIGDPTDKQATRTQLSQEEVLLNAATYKKQASKILKFSGENAAKLMFNHKWLGKMNFGEVLELASYFTVQQMQERDMFEKRLKAGKPVYLHEFLYPLMQGYDSVAMDVDLEIGGSDQTFNMLTGRTLMKQMKNKEKFVITLKLLTNAEGSKMSKTESGFIAMNDSPEEMYGKLMAMDDSMIVPYFELATDLPMEEIEGMKIAMERGMNPREVKAKLAQIVVAFYHSQKVAKDAAKAFDSLFQDHAVPADIVEYKLPEERVIVDVLVEVGLTDSKSEARRMVEQGAIKINGVRVDSIETMVKGSQEGIVLQRGKRNFVRLVD